MFVESFTFHDFLIQPAAYSRVKSRSKVNTSVRIGNLSLKLPVISASMSIFDTVSPFDNTISLEFAKAMSAAGGMHIFSRGTPFSERFNAVCKLSENGYNVGIAVSLDEFKENRTLLENIAAIVSIDIANGSIIDEIHWNSPYPLIVGNFANPSISLTDRFSGNIILKMGVGNGSACSTRVVTGVGAPQAGLVYDSSRNSNFPIISDGGISSVSDFTKAIALGADLVMTGRMFGHAVESPWEVLDFEGKKFKAYRGMASKEEKQSKKFVEGASGYIPFENKTVQEIMYDFSDGLTSAMSYCDSFNIKEFQSKASFISSSSHHLESAVRILSQ